MVHAFYNTEKIMRLDKIEANNRFNRFFFYKNVYQHVFKLKHGLVLLPLASRIYNSHSPRKVR